MAMLSAGVPWVPAGDDTDLGLLILGVKFLLSDYVDGLRFAARDSPSNNIMILAETFC